MLAQLKIPYYRPDKSIPAYLNKRPGKDAGYDLYAAEDIWLLPLQTKVIKTNSHIHIPDGHLGRVTSRSGHAAKGWLTHAGTVDHGYTGNIGVIQTNLHVLPRKIKKGTRIAQLIFMPFTAVELHEIRNKDEYQEYVSYISNSDRCDNGYNSSGIN
jgi:dUTP pyrophosphatase